MKVTHIGQYRYFRGDYTPEQKERFRKRDASQKKAKEYYINLYNESVANVIVANIMAQFTTVFRKSANTFEEAWERLGYEITSDIVFKAINDLPDRSKKQNEIERAMS